MHLRKSMNHMFACCFFKLHLILLSYQNTLCDLNKCVTDQDHMRDNQVTLHWDEACSLHLRSNPFLEMLSKTPTKYLAWQVEHYNPFSCRELWTPSKTEASPSKVRNIETKHLPDPLSGTAKPFEPASSKKNLGPSMWNYPYVEPLSRTFEPFATPLSATIDLTCCVCAWPCSRISAPCLFLEPLNLYAKPPPGTFLHLGFFRTKKWPLFGNYARSWHGAWQKTILSSCWGTKHQILQPKGTHHRNFMVISVVKRTSTRTTWQNTLRSNKHGQSKPRHYPQRTDILVPAKVCLSLLDNSNTPSGQNIGTKCRCLMSWCRWGFKTIHTTGISPFLWCPLTTCTANTNWCCFQGFSRQTHVTSQNTQHKLQKCQSN